MEWRDNGILMPLWKSSPGEIWAFLQRPCLFLRSLKEVKQSTPRGQIYWQYYMNVELGTHVTVCEFLDQFKSAYYRRA